MSREVTTFCRVCEPACGLIATVDEGELVAVRADAEHPVTKGFACPKGLAGLDIHRDPDRLDHPLRRNASGGFDRASWDDAIAEIATALGISRGAVKTHAHRGLSALRAALATEETR